MNQSRVVIKMSLIVLALIALGLLKSARTCVRVYVCDCVCAGEGGIGLLQDGLFHVQSLTWNWNLQLHSLDYPLIQVDDS